MRLSTPYLEARGPLGARNVQLAVQSTLARLADFPYLGRAQSKAGLRKLGVPRFRYNIYYTVDAVLDEVIIVTVRHTSRKRVYRDK